MPSFSPHQPPASHRARRFRNLVLLLLASTCTIAHAQQLARPGWVNSGLNADPWWKHAVFYRIDAKSADATDSTADIDYKAITARIDALHSLGVDALLLPMPKLLTPLATDTASAQDAGPADASLDDFDELMHQASRRSIRVLLTFTASNVTDDLPATARFWLSRGVAGFHVTTPLGTSPQDALAIVQSLRKITNSTVGARIVLSDFNPIAAPAAPIATPTSHSRSHYTSSRRSTSRHADRPGEIPAAAQLQIDPRLAHLDQPEAANLRPLLVQSLTVPNLLLDFHPPAPLADSPDPYPALAKAMATLLLTTHSAAMIDANQELNLQPDAPPVADTAQPPTPIRAVNKPIVATPYATTLPAPTLADWYSKLSALHHDNPTLRFGSISILNFDNQNALVWVSRPVSSSGVAVPVVITCNLSSSPLQLSLSAAIQSLGLRGSYLRTLLRSDNGMGAQNINSVTLPPYGVYIGELHR